MAEDDLVQRAQPAAAKKMMEEQKEKEKAPAQHGSHSLEFSAPQAGPESSTAPVEEQTMDVAPQIDRFVEAAETAAESAEEAAAALEVSETAESQRQEQQQHQEQQEQQPTQEQQQVSSQSDHEAPQENAKPEQQSNGGGEASSEVMESSSGKTSNECEKVEQPSEESQTPEQQHPQDSQDSQQKTEDSQKPSQDSQTSPEKPEKPANPDAQEHKTSPDQQNQQDDNDSVQKNPTHSVQGHSQSTSQSVNQSTSQSLNQNRSPNRISSAAAVDPSKVFLYDDDDAEGPQPLAPWQPPKSPVRRPQSPSQSQSQSQSQQQNQQPLQPQSQQQQLPPLDMPGFSPFGGNQPAGNPMAGNVFGGNPFGGNPFAGNPFGGFGATNPLQHPPPMFGQAPRQTQQQQQAQPQQQQQQQVPPRSASSSKPGSQHVWGVRHIADAVAAYEDWVRHGGSFIYSALNQIKSFTMMMPGRFGPGTIRVESFYALLNVLTAYHGRILEIPNPEGYSYFCGKHTPAVGFMKEILNVCYYGEVLVELVANRMAARSPAGLRAKWLVVGLVELTKVICRLGIWGRLRGGMLRTCSPEEAQATVQAARLVQPDRLRPEFRRHADLVELYCSRGRTGPDSDQEAARQGVHRFLQAEQHQRPAGIAPQEQLAELLHILRPLVYVACRFFSDPAGRSWSPFMTALTMDLASLLLHQKEAYRKSESEKTTLRWRYAALLFYLLRSPLYERKTIWPMLRLVGILSRVPLLGGLLGPGLRELVNCLPQHYFYTSNS